MSLIENIRAAKLRRVQVYQWRKAGLLFREIGARLGVRRYRAGQLYEQAAWERTTRIRRATIRKNSYLENIIYAAAQQPIPWLHEEFRK